MSKITLSERSLGYIFVLSWIVVFGAVLAIVLAADPSSRYNLEKNAISALRAYGENQLSYQNTNNDHNWGSWGALHDTGYCTSPDCGGSKGDLLEGYKLWTDVINNEYPEGIYMCSVGGTFTAIAFPVQIPPTGYLRTFAIREDQAMRVYVSGKKGVYAWGENEDFGARTWDPFIGDYPARND